MEYKKASTRMVKNINTANVLSLIAKNEPLSRADIAKKLHMSKSAISSIIDDLINIGYVREEGVGDSTIEGGRKPINLMFNSKIAHIIGINISGYNIRAILTDLKGEILKSKTIHLIDNKETINDIINIVEEFRLQSNNILGIGIGIPGIVNIEKSQIVSSPALHWEDISITDMLKEKLDMPIYIENDVKLSTLGEKWRGIGKGWDNFVYISVERGVGCGIIIDGKLYHGSNYTAGEIGYMVLGQNTRQSFTLNDYGSFELQAADHAMVRNALQLMNDFSNSYLHRYVADKKNITPQLVFEGYEQDDELCKRIINEYIDLISMGLVNLVVVLNPGKVILGGDLCYAGYKALKRIKETVDRIIPLGVSIEKSVLKKFAGCLGGVALVLEHDDILKGVVI